MPVRDFEAEGFRDAIAGGPMELPFDDPKMAFLNHRYERGYKEGLRVKPTLPCRGEHEYRTGWRKCPICGHEV